MMKDILQRQLEMKSLAILGAPFLSPNEKVICIEASKGMLHMLQESETNHFDGIEMGDKF
jgi:hypothetical protein